ncbi:MAG TPA: FtsX-like permease family protein [Bryobacteraceae bacterium]|nr:FtsX-like permease family protein [Bryobacteraceae bacterium]
MPSSFELFIARRYLKARRKEAVISVITLISILGVAAGVMALVVALAINNGFRDTLQRNLLGAMAHINVQEKEPRNGIENWEAMAARIRQLPHVTAAGPALYTPIFLNGPVQSKGGLLKGVNIGTELQISDTLRHLKAGSVDGLQRAPQDGAPGIGVPGIILGARLAEDIGMVLNSRVLVTSPQGELTPIGPRPSIRRFRVVGIFESGFYEIDDNWAYTSLADAQQALSLQDVVNEIEVKLDDLNLAPEVARRIEKIAGPKYATLTWMERNRQLLNALKMEKAVTVVTIGLIELVAALNILITLVMMVMEKYRDIAVLMSMGARRAQIRRIFMLQGILIGVVGTSIGLVVGYALCYFADRYRWIRLDEQIYALSFVPFEPRWVDGVWVAAAAILVSFLATIYPARSATRIAPAEVLRYE